MGHSIKLWHHAAGPARGLEGESHNDFGPGALGLMLREPVGVAGIVTPWNFPLLIGSERVPWAIGAGCTVVAKPSEFTSGSTIRMAELAREAGIPDGVINVVTGYGDPVGQLFAEHPQCDMINFTGSFRVGQIAGGKRLGNSGSSFAPNIFAEAQPEMSITRDEIFGPVLVVQSFDTPEEAVAMANDTNCGLSASIWNNDLTKAIQTVRKVRAGRTWINGAGPGGPEMGISGYKQSGLGRELGRHGFLTGIRC